jgi:hypothetical protein
MGSAPEGMHFKSMMGQDGKQQMGFKNAKSMMGDKDGVGRLMIVVVKR